MLPPEEHESGFKLWFDDFMTFWTALPNQELDQYGCYAQLFALLARDAIGYIDWEPHIAMLFTRLKKSFNGMMMLSTELTLTAQWIVYMIYPGSSCLANLRQLFHFKLVDTRNMLGAIMDEFIVRIRAERFVSKTKGKPWYDYVPETHKLTDELIVDFGQLMFEQYQTMTATLASSATDFDVEYLYKLSLFCSELLPAEVVDKLSLAHERFYEPARLQPALQLFSISLYHMLTNEKVGEGHRTHVIPIMSRLLGSLNTNDHSLCYLHLFAIRSIVILGLPLEDLSPLAKTEKEKLSSSQRKALRQTVQLESFAADFLSLCFTIIESNNEDLFAVSKKGLGMKIMLYDIFSHILVNVRPAKFRSLVDQLYRYVTSRTVEGGNSCFILHKLILATVMMDKEGYALPKFFKGITEALLESIDDKVKFSEVCRSEFSYHMALFTGTFKDGRAMLPFRDQLIDLFSRMFAIDFEENSQHIALVTNAIGCLFNVVTSVYPSEPSYGPGVYEAKDKKEQEEAELKQFLGWPHEVTLKELDNRWYEPGQEEVAFARTLFATFIKPQMDLLEGWVEGKVEVNKSALEKALGIILSFSGFRDCLPPFSDPEVAKEEKYFTTPDPFALEALFEGAPFRDELVALMGRVLGRLKAVPGDNVSPLRLIIKILDFAMFPADSVNTASPADFSLMEEFTADEAALTDLQSGGQKTSIFSSIFKPIGGKKAAFIPMVQYARIADFHMKMLSTLKSWPNAQLTSSHRSTIEHLLQLGTCSSSDVRIESQAILLDVMESYPATSAPMITGWLAGVLAKGTEDYDAFKGTLYLLLGTATKSLLLTENWSALVALWPTLLKINYVEKPKIVDLLDNDLLPLLHGYFYTVPVERKVAVLGAFEKDLFERAQGRGFRVPVREEVAKIEAKIEEANAASGLLYTEFVGQIVAILESQKL